MHGYQVSWDNHPKVDFSHGITLEGIKKGLVINNGYRVDKGEFYTQHSGTMRVQAENLAAAKQFAGEELARQLADKSWAVDVHFAVYSVKEEGIFAQLTWLNLTDYLGKEPTSASNSEAFPAANAPHKDKLVTAILAVTFSGIGLMVGWAPFGISFALLGLIFTIISWVRKNNRLLTIIATVLSALGMVISIIMSIVWLMMAR